MLVVNGLYLFVRCRVFTDASRACDI